MLTAMAAPTSSLATEVNLTSILVSPEAFYIKKSAELQWPALATSTVMGGPISSLAINTLTRDI
jgi:hypothetical protein